MTWNVNDDHDDDDGGGDEDDDDDDDDESRIKCRSDVLSTNSLYCILERHK